jgi:hypothetical protein
MNRSFAAALAFALFFSAIASADTVSIPASADTTLNERAADNNMGRANVLQAGTDGMDFHRRGLLRFDVASNVPAGATIDSASMSLFATTSNQTSQFTHDLFRVLVPWGEGMGVGLPTGQPAATGDATWNSNQHNTSEWNLPGAVAGIDYALLPSSSQFIAASGPYAFNNLAADAQSMLDNPAANYGWILISTAQGELMSTRQFESRETTAGHPPLLTIEYTPIPEPWTALIAVLIILIATAKFRLRGIQS